MKKRNILALISLILASVMLFSLTACTAENNTETEKTQENDSAEVTVSEVNGTENEADTGIDDMFIGYPAYPVAVVYKKQIYDIRSYEKGEAIIDALRGAEKKDVDWSYDDTVLKFIVNTATGHYEIHLTYDGNIIYRREYYETKDGETLLKLLSEHYQRILLMDE